MTDRPKDPTPDQPSEQDGAPPKDPLDSLANQMFADIQRESERSGPARGGLDWIRSTLRTGGADQDPMIGQLFQEKYRILRRIGRGGFGSVYEAVDERGAKNRVALKVQLPGFTSSVTRREMFRNEAMRVTRLNHPNIVNWKSFDVTPDGGSYFVMELLDGVELSQELKRTGVIPYERALTLLLQILEALVAAHFLGKGQSILHLDLKPKNILLLPANETRPEQIKVIDFGIGQFLGGDETDPLAMSEPSTEMPAVPAAVPVEKGTMTAVSTANTEAFNRRASKYSFEISRAYTAEYASPEQCGHIAFALGSKNEPVALDGRSDLYSFGVIAYELLTGRLPWKAPHIRELWLNIHQETPIQPWGDVEAKVPLPLRAFVERCLAKDREQRFDDSREALEALQRIANPARTWRLVAAAVLFVLVGGISAFYMFWSPKGSLHLHTQGQELTKHHLGPQSPAWIIDVRADDKLLSDRVAKDLRLLEGDGQELAGWIVEPTLDAERILVRPTPEFLLKSQGREYFERVYVQSRNGIWESRVFEFTWLGQATSRTKVSIGDLVIHEGDVTNLDPAGLLLDVTFPELQTEDLDPTRWHFEPAGSGQIRLSGNGLASGAGLRVRLGALPAGTTELVLWGEDNSGRAHRKVLPIQLSAETLESQIHLQAEAGAQARPWNPNKPEVFFQHDKNLLTITTNRPCEIEWPFDPTSPATTHTEAGTLNTHSLATWLSEETRVGEKYTLRFPLKDEVLHDPKTRGAYHRKTITLQLEVAEAEDIDWFLEGVPTPIEFSTENPDLTMSDGATPISLRPYREVPLGRMEVEIQVGAETDQRLGPWSGQEKIEITQQVLGSAMKSREGLVPIRVFSYRLNTAGERSPATPQSTKDLQLLIDRSPPSFGPLPPTLPVLTGYENNWQLRVEHLEDGGSDVVLPWELAFKQSKEPVLFRTAGPKRDSAGSSVFLIDPLAELGEAELLADDQYVLILTAKDRAGNETKIAEIEGEVARHGPRLRVKSPEEVNSEGMIDWVISDHQLETIRLNAIDKNGVQSVRCFVYRMGPDGAALANTEFPLEPGTVIGDQWSWDFDPPPAWSRAEDVYLRFEALDRYGQATTLNDHGPLRMPRVDPRYEPRIGNMLLVPGNKDSLYIFKGRTDVVLENRCFKEAGLGPIWVAPGREKPGVAESGWGLEFPAGTIQSYYLSEQKVSNKEFLEFLHDTHRGYMSSENWAGGFRPENERRTAIIETLSRDAPENAAEMIWQKEARAYAAYRNKRLPTLLELTYAIRGGPDNYRAQSWDVSGDQEHNPDDPWRRIRGLSWGAEWTSSPVQIDRHSALPAHPTDPRHFLPDARPMRRLDDPYWIRGTPRGYPALVGADLRADFAAVDQGAPVNWEDEYVGFRLAWDADEASAASRRQPQGQEQE